MQIDVKDELRHTLHGMLAGEIPLVEGCRAVTKSLQYMEASVTSSEPAVTIAGIESETDSFPVGPERQHWAQNALERADAELAEYLERVRDTLLDACRSLQEHLSGIPTPWNEPMNTPVIGNAFTLRFDTKAEVVTPPVDIDGETLMARLASRGFVAFRLQWEDSFEAQLAIEDDVIFICDAVEELAAFATGEHAHYVHLGDGELEITSTLSAGVVTSCVDHTPHLDQRFHRRYELTSTLHQYVSAWYSLVAALKAIAR